MKNSFIKLISAPCHEDNNPSCAVYDNGSGYCFPCSKYYPAGTFGPELPEVGLLTPPEDIKSKIQYIKELPKQEIRGLLLPFDSKGYYIVWPDESYYKLRKWLPDPAKYANPRGITQPGFYIKGKNSTLVIVEGEINALTIHKIYPKVSVLSPGSAGNFKERLLKNYLPDMAKYVNIIIIVDYDKAGLTALKETKALLNKQFIYPKIYLNSLDVNDLLVKYGETKVKEELKDVGL